MGKQAVLGGQLEKSSGFLYWGVIVNKIEEIAGDKGFVIPDI